MLTKMDKQKHFNLSRTRANTRFAPTTRIEIPKHLDIRLLSHFLSQYYIINLLIGMTQMQDHTEDHYLSVH